MPAVKHTFTSEKSDGGDATLVRPSDWNAEHSGNSLPSLVVAANDSSAKDKLIADYVCDAVADDVQIQAAIDALGTRGGTVILAPGRYEIATAVVVGTAAAAKRVTIWGYGALLALAASQTGLKINQGSTSTVRGVHVYGLRIDGLSNASTTGVIFEDTNWSGLYDVLIDNVATGILMHANATNEFVEGIQLEDVVIRNSTTYGIEYRRTDGTNSFGQHSYRSLQINVGAGTGFKLPSACSIYRSRMHVQIWIGTDETAFDVDGDVDGASLQWSAEGATGSTGNTALIIGNNATNMDRADIEWYDTGTINTRFTVASGKDFAYHQGRNFRGHTQNTTSPLRVMSHADTAAKITLGINGVGGGRITLGNGSGTNDVYIERNAANKMVASGKWKSTSLNLQTKAGAPADSDITGGAEVGDIVYDTTNKRLNVRTGTDTFHVINEPVISRGGTVLSPSGAVNVIVWRAPFACTVTNVRGYRVGGTGAEINARRNNADNHLASALSLTNADQWMDGGAVQNTAYAAGDEMEIMVVSVAGSPTQVAVQVELTRP